MLCSHSPLRRYEREPHSRVDPKRDALSKLNKLPTRFAGSGYYLIDAGNGVVSSLSLFETREQGKESTKLVATGSASRSSTQSSPTSPRSRTATSSHSDRVPVAA
jgi:hypothetical protein